MNVQWMASARRHLRTCPHPLRTRLLPPPPGYEQPEHMIMQGLVRARDVGFIDWAAPRPTFDLAKYEHYEQVVHGDWNWIVPGKMIAFSGPTLARRPPGAISTLGAEDYVPLWQAEGVTTVVRLNKAVRALLSTLLLGGFFPASLSLPPLCSLLFLPFGALGAKVGPPCWLMLVPEVPWLHEVSCLSAGGSMSALRHCSCALGLPSLDCWAAAPCRADLCTRSHSEQPSTHTSATAMQQHGARAFMRAGSNTCLHKKLHV